MARRWLAAPHALPAFRRMARVLMMVLLDALMLLLTMDDEVKLGRRLRVERVSDAKVWMRS